MDDTGPIANGLPVETDAARLARLTGELAASGRVNHLLQEAGARVVWNNDHLRAAMRWTVERIGDPKGDPMLEAIVERLAAAMSETLSNRMGTGGSHDG